MNTVIRFFIVFGSTIAFANLTLVSAKGSSDNVPKIKSDLNDVKNTVLNEQSTDNFGGSISDLLIFVKSLLSVLSTGSLSLLPNLLGEISSELKCDSNDGLLGAIFSGLTAGFKDAAAEAIINGLKASGLDSQQMTLVTDKIIDALELSKDAQNGDLLTFVKTLLNIVGGFIVQYLSTTLTSGIDGLVTDLSEGLHKNGLLGGVLCGVGGLAEGLKGGDEEGMVDYLGTFLA